MLFTLFFFTRQDIAKNMEEKYGNITAATKVKKDEVVEMADNDLYVSQDM